MSFDLPDTIRPANYTYDEQAFLKMAHILHVLKQRYPHWTFQVKSVSHCSIKLMFNGYERYLYNVNAGYCVGNDENGKLTFETHLANLDRTYIAKFNTDPVDPGSPDGLIESSD